MPVSPKAQEPSMDEILDSIRRIIADEDLALDLSSPHGGGGHGSAGGKRGGEALQAPAGQLPPIGAYRGRPHLDDVAHKPARYGAPQPAAAPRPVERAQSSMRVVSQPSAGPEHASERFGVRGPDTQMPRAQAPERTMMESRTERGYGQEQARASWSSQSAPFSAPLESSSSVAVAQQDARATTRGDFASEEVVHHAHAGADVRVHHDAQAGSGQRPLPPRDLLSPAVDAAVMASFKSLGDLVLPQQERTVEDLVKEILRPMLKDWLDKNLSGIVERLVRAEIERVTNHLR